jgi:sec-independent protein translocase protein TatA
MPNIGAPELIIVLVIAVLILGPGKLPEVGASIGKSLREFRKASSDSNDGTGADVGSDAAQSG